MVVLGLIVGQDSLVYVLIMCYLLYNITIYYINLTDLLNIYNNNLSNLNISYAYIYPKYYT